MVITSTPRTAGPFFGDDVATVFPYGFRILGADDLEVRLSQTGVPTAVLVRGVDYEVTGADAGAGGDVVLAAPLAAGQRLDIIGAASYEQPLALENQGQFFARDVMRALDRLAVQAQQLKEAIDRAVVIPPEDDVTDTDLLIASLTSLDAIKADLQALAAIIPDIQTTAGIAADVTTVSSINANVTTVAGITADIAVVVANIAAIQGALGNAQAAANDRVQTGLDRVATAADRVQTGLDKVATAADRVQTGLDRAAAELAAASLTVASKAEAEAGVDNVKLMTPLRVEQHLAAKRIGWGRTWQDMTGSRAKATDYQNTLPYPILVQVRSIGANGARTLHVGGSTGAYYTGSFFDASAGFPAATLLTVVPPGWYYRYTGVDVGVWGELR